jgi:hypothetical protein
MDHEAIVDHEQTQFLHSNFHVDKNKTAEKQVAQETQEQLEQLEPSFDIETKAEAEAELKSISTATATDDEIFVEVFENDKPQVAPLSATTQKENSVISATPNTPIVSDLPPHFDDPRFDERVLRTKKKNRISAHDQPIASSEELMALVLADTPPKLRSVAAPALVQQEKSKTVDAASQKNALPKSKDDSKSNLIDFDVFAEPEPLNKPTRFIR